MRGSHGLSKPPEGALVGENVPVENQQVQFEDSEIERLMGKLKSRGKPYIDMGDRELEEKAINLLEKYGDM